MVGKYISLIGGLAAIVLGIAVLMRWWDDVLVVARAVLVAILIFGGLLAFFVGAGEIKDAAAQKEKK